MIVILDYKMGNVGSIRNMLKKIGAPATVSCQEADVEAASRLVLPGVGSFDKGVRMLHETGLVDLINRKVTEDKTPVLGICLGMHLMTRRSSEGNLAGLGWLDAETVKFAPEGTNGASLKVPHMGWNTVEPRKPTTLLDGIETTPRFYFVHSYFVRCAHPSDILLSTCYGGDFVSAFQRDNVLGVQFHPEKSHKYGMRLLANWLGATAGTA